MDKGPDFDANGSRHGTRSRYKAGCRCDECRGANSGYQLRRRAILRAEALGDDSDVGRDEWMVPVVGVVAAVALVSGVIRRAASS